MKWLTLKEAAERAGVLPDTLRQQIHNGRLAATKLGRDWVVTEKDLTRYIRERDAVRPPAA